MTPRPRAIVLCLALLPLSALAAPAGTADGVQVARGGFDIPRPAAVDPRLVPQEADALGWGCDEYKSNWDPGRIAITGRGTFYTIGQLTDGCGGRGCDDQLEGDLYVPSRQEWLPFGVYEVRASNGCFFSCWVETRSGRISGIRGSLTFDYADEASYSCHDYYGTWLFGGSQSPPDAYPPPYELPGAQW